MASRQQARQPAAATKKVVGNDFHRIRVRELMREQECMRGGATEPTAAYFTPSLKEICAKTIADTFEQHPNNIDGLEDDLYRLVTDQLSTDLSLEVSVPHIRVPEYWRACCEANWSSGQLAEYCKSRRLEAPEVGGWKRVFLERTLEERLMSLEFGMAIPEKDEDAIKELCSLCRSEIYSLHLSRLRCHLDMHDLIAKFPHLSELKVTYGVLNAGMMFKMDMLGMKQADALSLQKSLKKFSQLRTLMLPENRMDEDMVKALLGGLVRNTTLTHLDLSHNRIDDGGCAALATILMKSDCALRVLLLGDNNIRRAGGKSIGKALTVNKTLETLDLRLNRLEDEGGRAIIEALCANKSATSLNLANNELAAESARSLSDAMRTNAVLHDLNLSGNTFQEEGGRVLLSAVKSGTALHSIDVRMCGVGQNEEQEILAITRKRVIEKKNKQIEAAENQMREEIAKQVAEKVKRSHGA